MKTHLISFKYIQHGSNVRPLVPHIDRILKDHVIQNAQNIIRHLDNTLINSNLTDMFEMGWKGTYLPH